MTKHLMAIATVAILSTAFAVAQDVKTGDSRETVVRTLGNPAGNVSFGNQEVLYYPRGEVSLEDGKVVGSSILSESEFRRRQQARLAEEEEARKAAEEVAAAAPPVPASEPAVEEEDAPTQEELEAEARRQAELEARIEEGMRDPPRNMSSRQLRKFRRGRSASLLEEREAQLREEFEDQE